MGIPCSGGVMSLLMFRSGISAVTLKLVLAGAEYKQLVVVMQKQRCF